MYINLIILIISVKFFRQNICTIKLFVYFCIIKSQITTKNDKQIQINYFNIMKLRFYIPLVLSLLGCLSVKGQDIAVKTNLLYDATATINLGIETGLAPNWTLDVSGNLNAWKINEQTRWKHWMVQPEARYWFCDRFSGHFVGLHLQGGQYNLGKFDLPISFLGTDFGKFADHRYQGWAVGGGIAYGYALILNKSWNLEFEVGAGYGYFNFDKFECDGCGRKVGSGDHHYWGVTKAAVNLVYLF